MTPPIRFLALVVGGWAVARALSLAPGAGTAQERVESHAAPVAERTERARAPLAESSVPVHPGQTDSESNAGRGAVRLARGSSPLVRQVTATKRQITAFATVEGIAKNRAGAISLYADPIPLLDSNLTQRLAAVSMPQGGLLPQPAGVSAIPFPAPSLAVVPASRLSVDAWMLARNGAGAGALAGNSALLGGSQAGARLLYRVTGGGNAPLSLSTRLSSPLRRAGTEAAIGVEWQPAAAVPVRLLAERRERVTGTTRSAFALLAHGGVSKFPIAVGFRLDAYAQAGVVGMRRRDLFADGGATLVRPLGSSAEGPALGVGAWGGARPGASRLDIGPRLTTTLAAEGVRARVSLDWRFRVAGDAAPASGPALTLATGF